MIISHKSLQNNGFCMPKKDSKTEVDYCDKILYIMIKPLFFFEQTDSFGHGLMVIS